MQLDVTLSIYSNLNVSEIPNPRERDDLAAIWGELLSHIFEENGEHFRVSLSKEMCGVVQKEFELHERMIKMYIYWESDYHSHLKKIPKNLCWHLYCESDEWGNECLYLDIEDEAYCITESEEWTSGRPDLQEYHVAEFYSAVVREVLERIKKKENLEVINLMEIQEKVIESFWRDWQEKGYVED